MEITVPGDEGAPPQRLDRALADCLPQFSRSRLQALIKGGAISVGGRPVTKPRHPVTPGEKIVIEVPEPEAADAQPEDIPLQIIHEDEHLVVVNKAHGMVVHPAAGNPGGTLVNALLHHCGGELSGIGGVERPGIVHRLDKDTSGTIIVAKTDPAHRALVEAFSERRTRKLYLAAVEGTPPDPGGEIRNRIGRHPVDRKRMALVPDPKGKRAASDWDVISKIEGSALLRFRIHTGRTHQIRVHCRECLRTPILGDPLYAKPPRQSRQVARMMLHAWHLELDHPVTGEPLSFTSPPPPDFDPWLGDLGVNLPDPRTEPKGS